jgi:hypothetical protein
VPLWSASVIAILWLAVRAWRPGVPLRVRLALVVLAAVLVNPHMYVYDAVVLALPLLWLGAWHVTHGDARSFAAIVFALCVAVWSLMPVSLALGPGPGIVSMTTSVLLVVLMFITTARLAEKV